MRQTAHWLFGFWFLVSMLLPGEIAYRFCGCAGALSFARCVCEEPKDSPFKSCCEKQASTSTAPEGVQLRRGASCNGCLRVTTPQQTPRVLLPTTFAPAALLLSAALLRVNPPPTRTWTMARPTRAHDPPCSRRNLELRV